MSKLAVTQIETGDTLTPLTITTGNATSGSIKVQSANSDIVFNGSMIINSAINEKVYTLTDAATVDINPQNGSIQLLTLTSTGRTLSFANMVNGEALTLMINDGTSGTITTWAATFVNGGGAPTLSTTGYTVVSIWKVGGIVYAATVGND